MTEAQARAAYDAIKVQMSVRLGRPELATSMASQELSAAAKEAGLSAEFEAARDAWWAAQCAEPTTPAPTDTFSALTRAKQALDDARHKHDSMLAAGTSAEITAAYHAFCAAETAFDAALRANKEAQAEREADAEAEREHLAGQAARTEAAAYELDYAKHPTSVTLASGLIIPTKSILCIVKQDGQDFVRTKMLAGAHPVHADAAATIRALMADLGNTYAALHPDAITTELTRLFPEPAPAKREPRPTDLTPDEILAINDALALESTRERRGPDSLALDLAVDVRAAMNAGDWDGVSALGVLLVRKGAA